MGTSKELQNRINVLEAKEEVFSDMKNSLEGWFADSSKGFLSDLNKETRELKGLVTAILANARERDTEFERRCHELTNSIKEARTAEIRARDEARAVEQRTVDALAAREVTLLDSLAGFSSDFNNRILPILERIESLPATESLTPRPPVEVSKQMSAAPAVVPLRHKDTVQGKPQLIIELDKNFVYKLKFLHY
ncbi:hypothetical protein JTE90_019781 [Oedothorax gibbosus]|uniref:Uncharacterized protein n=1 Tax=Oedothorax gibbosus TaxID=931172 RepID=A0AAV6TGN0_9ARAC|nr:hypothetical protein JTE90_019781 [Oedothorax gibbosus]